MAKVNIATIETFERDVDEVHKTILGEISTINRTSQELRSFYRSDSAKTYDQVKGEWDTAAKHVQERLAEISVMLNQAAKEYGRSKETQHGMQRAGLTGNNYSNINVA